jgi:hypothetical protein
MVGELPQGYALQDSDVGRSLSLGEGFGVVLPGDVGRRCWSKRWGLVMESRQQRDERLNAQGPGALI